MATAHVGKDPRWFEPVQDRTKTGRLRNKITVGEEQWTLDSGWHPKRPRSWKNINQLKKSTLTDSKGQKYEIYRNQTYDDRTSFAARTDEQAFEFAQKVFNPSTGIGKGDNDVIHREGCGHIKNIWYSPKNQLLRVEFVTNGAICIFFRVPTQIGGLLIYHATNKDIAYTEAKTGIQRHALGVEFWNLVRIRGQLRGANYPWAYEKHGTYRLTNSNRRYTITLTEKNVGKILGIKPSWFKPGMKLSSIISEEEFAKYAPYIDEFDHEQAQLATDFKQYVDKSGNVVEKENASNASMSAEDEAIRRMTVGEHAQRTAIGAQDMANPLTPEEQLRYADYKEQYDRANELHRSNVVKARYEEQADLEQEARAREAEVFSVYEAMVRSGAMTSEELQQVLNNMTEESGSRFYDKRYKAGNAPARTWVEKVRDMPKRNAFDNQENYLDYVRLEKKHDGATYIANARRQLKPVKEWSKEDLIILANPNLPNGEGIERRWANEYKGYIKRGDYRGAFNFIKGLYRPIYDNKGKFIGREPYVGDQDQYRGD